MIGAYSGRCDILRWLITIAIEFAVGYAIREILAKKDGLKLNGTYQLMVWAEVDYVLGKDVSTIKIIAMLY